MWNTYTQRSVVNKCTPNTVHFVSGTHPGLTPSALSTYSNPYSWFIPETKCIFMLHGLKSHYVCETTACIPSSPKVYRNYVCAKYYVFVTRYASMLVVRMSKPTLLQRNSHLKSFHTWTPTFLTLPWTCALPYPTYLFHVPCGDSLDVISCYRTTIIPCWQRGAFWSTRSRLMWMAEPIFFLFFLLVKYRES